MGYRKLEPKPKKPRRTMEKLASPSDFYMALDTTANFAIPCWYIEVRKPRPAHLHNRPHHDYCGWPDPKRVDHSCQAWDFAHDCCSHDHSVHHCDSHCKNFIDPRKLIPIHLTEEGYTDIHIVCEFMEGDNRVSLDGVGVIDPKDDWIVRLFMRATSNDRESNDVKPFDKAYFRVSVFVEGDKVLSERFDKHRNKKDLLCQAKVCVSPTAVEE